MITPTPNDAGRAVLYRSQPGAPPMRGLIRMIDRRGLMLVAFELHATTFGPPYNGFEWATVDKPREAAIIDDILGAE